MPWLQLDAIATKIYDLLRQDPRTIEIDWYNGRRSPAQMQQSPAGNVFIGPGTITPYTIPGGDQADVQMVVEVWYGSQEGATNVEQRLRTGLDDVAAVLADAQSGSGRTPWDLGLTYCYITGIGFVPDVNPEASPAWGSVRFLVDIKILPTT